MDDFIWRAWLGGLGVAILCGPLGCLVVWQRMAYFGATLAHAALLGIALGLALSWPLQLAILGVSLAVSMLLLSLGDNRFIASDTLLGIIAHGALALGLVLLAFLPGVQLDLHGYLFGDILAIGRADLGWIFGGGCAVLLALIKIWRPLLALVIQRDLALVAGVQARRIRAVFFVLLSLVVAVAMQVVGLLLIVSLLIIPAATARYFARSPEAMAGLAIVFGGLAVSGGLGLSLGSDAPTGPAVVTIAALLFALLGGVRFLHRRRGRIRIKNTGRGAAD